MTQPFENKNTEIVLGLSKYKTYKYSFLNKVIQYDAFITAINYSSFALAKQPYMGIGRNLAYRKHTFLNSTILEKTKRIASGDDDLLINEIANEKNTQVCLDSNAITISEPKKNWRAYFIQKTRHFSTPGSYKLRDKIILTINYLSYFATSILIVITIIDLNILYLILIIIFKKIGDEILLSKFLKILNYKNLLWYSIILEIFLIGLQPIIYLTSILTLNKKWK